MVYDSGYLDGVDTRQAPIRTGVVALPDLDSEITLLITPSNDYARNAGFGLPLEFGSIDVLQREQQTENSLSAAIIAILAGFAIFNFTLWLARGQQLGLLMLSLISVTAGGHMLTSTTMLYNFFPETPIWVGSTWGWLTFLMGSPAGIIYFRVSIPHLIPRWLLIAGVLPSLFGLILLTQPTMQTVQAFADIYRPFILLITFLAIVYLSLGLRSSDHEFRVDGYRLL